MNRLFPLTNKVYTFELGASNVVSNLRGEPLATYCYAGLLSSEDGVLFVRRNNLLSYFSHCSLQGTTF